jgi:hypothetical protein
MNIAFLDLKKQYALMKDEIDDAVGRVVGSGVYIGGDEVAGFEKELESHAFTGRSGGSGPGTSAGYAVSVSSGTDALLASLMALGVKEGDEVITSPFTFIATAEVISFLGARPVFVDIERRSFNIDPGLIEEKITERTRCIIPVHLFGLMADMEKILKIAKRRELGIVEDAAQAIGSSFGGRKACTFGDAGCLSFFPSKNLGCFGDGGAVLTGNEELAGKIRVIKEHGSDKRYHHSVVGFNGRLDALQAAVLRVKLRSLDQWAERRREHARYYSERLKDLVSVPAQPDRYYHVFNQYSILSDRRDELCAHLKAKGVPTMIYYPVPLHLQKVFLPLGYREGNFPVAEEVSEKVLSLPVYPELPEAEREFVADSVVSFFKK